jgi:hypothetical protein
VLALFGLGNTLPNLIVANGQCLVSYWNNNADYDACVTGAGVIAIIQGQEDHAQSPAATLLVIVRLLQAEVNSLA